MLYLRDAEEKLNPQTNREGKDNNTEAGWIQLHVRVACQACYCMEQNTQTLMCSFDLRWSLWRPVEEKEKILSNLHASEWCREGGRMKISHWQYHVYRIVLLNKGSPSESPGKLGLNVEVFVFRCQPPTLNSSRGVREKWCHAKVWQNGGH